MKVLTYLALLALAAGTNATSTSCYAADPAKIERSSQVSTRPIIEGAVQKQKVTPAPRRQIDFGQSTKKHSSNSFQDISASMPAAAVKENLARKHELPNAQTSVLQPGAAVGGMARPGASAAPAPNSTAKAPETLSPNGVAVQEPKGATTNNFYK